MATDVATPATKSGPPGEGEVSPHYEQFRTKVLTGQDHVAGSDHVSYKEDAASPDKHVPDPNVLDKWKSPSVLEREEKDAAMRERCASCIALGEIDRTYFLFGPENPLRRGCEWLAAWKWFDRFVLICILANCVTLGMYDPLEPDKAWMDVAEYIFLVAFTFEFMVKSIAWGFVFGEETYLRNMWNCLDFFVVVTAYISLSGSGNFGALRALRGLRPLRTVTVVPGMKMLVSALLESIPLMLDVLALMLFFFLVFGIISVGLWKGVLDGRCHEMLDPAANDTALSSWTVVPGAENVPCGLPGNGGNGKCGEGARCIDTGVPPWFGYISFDNVLWSFLVLMQTVFMQSWNGVIAYQLMDSVGTASIIWFIIVILLGSLFVLQLVVAVISSKFDQLSEEQRSEDARDRRHKATMELKGVVEEVPPPAWYETLFERVKAMWVFRSNPLEVTAPLRAMIERAWFNNVVLFVIILNTACMATHHYGMPGWLEDVLEGFNYFFLGFFVLEMVVKHLALGFVGYWREGWNILDGLIVIFGLVEAVGSGANLSAIRVLRVFRVLRTLKVMKENKSMRKLLHCMIRGILGLREFGLLLLLFIFIFNIVGMQSFGGKDEFKGQRRTFDTFWQGFLTLFEMLTGNSYFEVMWATMKSNGNPAVTFTCVWMVVGNLTLLTLFLAILINEFKEASEDLDRQAYEEAQRLLAEENRPPSAMAKKQRRTERRQRRFARDNRKLKAWLIDIGEWEEPEGEEAEAEETHDEVSDDTDSDGEGRPDKPKGGLEGTEPPQGVSRASETPSPPCEPAPPALASEASFDDKLHAAISPIPMDSPAQKYRANPSAAAAVDLNAAVPPHKAPVLEDVSRTPSLAGGAGAGAAPRAREVFSKDHVPPPPPHQSDHTEENMPGSADASEEDGDGRGTRGSGSGSGSGPVPAARPPSGPRVRSAGPARHAVPSLAPRPLPGGPADYTGPGVASDRGPGAGEGVIRSRAVSAEDLGRPGAGEGGALGDPVSEAARGGAVHAPRPGAAIEMRWMEMGGGAGRAGAVAESAAADAPAAAAAGAPRQPMYDKAGRDPNAAANGGRATPGSGHDDDEDLESSDEEYIDENATPLEERPYMSSRALMCLGPYDGNKSTFRFRLGMLALNKYFDNTILFLIIVSSIFLALESPTWPAEGSTAEDVFRYCDIAFTIVFTCEALVKITVMGFVMHEGAYLRSKWNSFDFLIVVTSIIGVVLNNDSLAPIRLLRLLRTLRPLRMISRFQGLKIVVEAVIAAIPSVFHVVLVGCMMFLIFSILGYQLFGGKMWRCNDGSVASRAECVGTFDDGAGRVVVRAWRNADLNFDNVLQGFVTLFSLSTGDSWTDTMFNCMDIVGEDQQPVFNNQPHAAIFFVVFLFLGFFFWINLLVSVMVDFYSNAANKVNLVTDDQKNWFVVFALTAESNERRFKSKLPANPFRRAIFRICVHDWFEPVMIGVIMVNVMVMATEHKSMSQGWEDMLYVSNITFTVIYAIEAGMKIITMYWGMYWSSWWNRFDFVIVIISIVDLSYSFGGFAAAFRVARIGRMFKIVKSAKELRALFNTFITSLPAIVNVGSLLLLLMFVYAVLGMNLFGELPVDLPTPTSGPGLVRYQNFENFPNALFSLFQAFTGNFLYMLTSTYVDCGGEEGFYGGAECTNRIAPPFYFSSYLLLATYMMLNLLVAVVMEKFFDSATAEGLLGVSQMFETVRRKMLLDRFAAALAAKVREYHQSQEYLQSERFARRSSMGVMRIPSTTSPRLGGSMSFKKLGGGSGEETIDLSTPPDAMGKTQSRTNQEAAGAGPRGASNKILPVSEGS